MFTTASILSFRAPAGRSCRVPATARSTSGLYMVELLIAIAASSLLAAALVTSMAESMRLADYGQHQIMAATIIQQQIDSARNTPYNALVANRTTTAEGLELKTTSESLYGQTTQVLAPRPLLLDSSRFEGRVFEKIENGPNEEQEPPKTLKVTITVTWTEGAAKRRYSMSTVVAESGINAGGDFVASQ